jgi:hypothetical protein
MQKETLDLTPTWQGLMPAFKTVMEAGTPEGKKVCWAEMQKMARAADYGVNAMKAMVAMKARIEGEWDRPELQAIGVLGKIEDDIRHIIKHYLGEQ